MASLPTAKRVSYQKWREMSVKPAGRLNVQSDIAEIWLT